MRHGNGYKKLNRTASHRLAMFANMANSLIIHEQIKTTLVKAKELRGIVDKLITLGKKGTLADRRLAFARLRDEAAVAKLFAALATRYKERKGGYTRVIKAGFRYGDAADMAIIELVDRNVNAKGAADKERVKKAKLTEGQEDNKDQKSSKPAKKDKKAEADKKDKTAAVKKEKAAKKEPVVKLTSRVRTTAKGK
jgi:large subunit ribosomal protein L17